MRLALRFALPFPSWIPSSFVPPISAEIAVYVPLPCLGVSSTTAYIAAPACVAARTGEGSHCSFAAHCLRRPRRSRRARAAARHAIIPPLAAAAVAPPLCASRRHGSADHCADRRGRHTRRRTSFRALFDQARSAP
ncbi:MAG: hypothetical protein PPHERAN_0585 [uncultured Paraburkholderia sp.]|nr:MAG: hypothetical protein PPHERAN_0585 [uncultured Paraburkholderia sp.]